MSQEPSQPQHPPRRALISTEAGDRIVAWTIVVVLATQILSFGWFAPALTRYGVIFVAMVPAQAGFLALMFRRRLYQWTVVTPSAYRPWPAVALLTMACVIVELAIALAPRVLMGRSFG